MVKDVKVWVIFLVKELGVEIGEVVVIFEFGGNMFVLVMCVDVFFSEKVIFLFG